ncbi:MAG: NfeD family protein [Thermoprotei archaeon]
MLVDLYHPTGVLTVVGLTSLVLGLYGMGVVGASPIAILLFALAGAFMFLELKAGHGLFAASGVVISLVALFMIYGEVIIPSVHGAPSAPGYFSTKPIYTLLTGIEFGVLAAALGLAVLYLDKVREALKTKPKLMDNERLVGMIGRASVDFENGKGTVIVRSEEWSAISDDLIRKGDRVKVLAVNGIILKVKKEADGL